MASSLFDRTSGEGDRGIGGIFEGRHIQESGNIQQMQVRCGWLRTIEFVWELHIKSNAEALHT